MISTLLTFGLLFALTQCSNGVVGQIAYTRHLSDLRIKELQNLAVRLEHSILKTKSPCQFYYEHVCSRRRPIFTILGNLPAENELIDLLIDLQNDNLKFDAKRKMIDFFLSCNSVKSIDDCYRETFDYFRPLFGYIVANKHMDRHDHRNLMDVLDRFIARVRRMEDVSTHSFRFKLETLRDKFKDSHIFFKSENLDREYEHVQIYRDGYESNKKELDEQRKKYMAYDRGMSKVMLDWTMFMYQGRNKPMSYYFATLNVHLWMMYYNTTGRTEQKKFNEIADCLKLPPAINALDEARLLAVIYIKSFQNAWADYREWITSTTITQEIYDHENEILKRYNLDNKRLFFTLYAQNFCEFGKILADNVFFLGLKQNHDFYTEYSCGYQTLKGVECV